MRLKTHVATALATAPLVAYTVGGVHFLLMGAVFPDTDLLLYGKGHRVSLLHSIEIPLVGFLFLWFVRIPYVFGLPIGYFAFCFFAGWLAHLLGDFFQGGVGSLVLKKRVGIKSFNWNKYHNTPAGLGIDTLAFLAGVWGVYTGIISRGLYLSLVPVAIAWRGKAINIFVTLAVLAIAVNVAAAMM